MGFGFGDASLVCIYIHGEFGLYRIQFTNLRCGIRVTSNMRVIVSLYAISHIAYSCRIIDWSFLFVVLIGFFGAE